MTGRLMTPYCHATKAVAALVADEAFVLAALRAFALRTTPGSDLAVPLEPAGGLAIHAGESPFELEIVGWAA